MVRLLVAAALSVSSCKKRGEKEKRKEGNKRGLGWGEMVERKGNEMK